MAARLALALVAAMTVVDATALQDRTARALAAMSEVERIHANLFLDLAPGARPLDTLSSSALHVDFADIGTGPRSVAAAIQGFACSNNAALVVTIRSAVSHPTGDGQFLFTTNTAEVVRVLKAPVGAMKPGQRTVTVVRPGGQVVVEGNTVTADHSAHPPLVVGETYLVLAAHVERTGAFRAGDLGPTFRLQSDIGTKVGPLPMELGPKGLSRSELERVVQTANCAGLPRPEPPQ